MGGIQGVGQNRCGPQDCAWLVPNELRGLMSDDRKTLQKGRHNAESRLNRTTPTGIPQTSRQIRGRTSRKMPERVDTKVLSQTVEILGKLEQSRSGYDLLRQLVTCSSDDLDKWNSLMLRWSATSAEIVLGELERRLTVIKDLQELIP